MGHCELVRCSGRLGVVLLRFLRSKYAYAIEKKLKIIVGVGSIGHGGGGGGDYGSSSVGL